MKFFDNLFHMVDNNYYGVSGLNTELSCVYIYNAFLSYKSGMIVVTNSLYEANLIILNCVTILIRYCFFLWMILLLVKLLL